MNKEELEKKCREEAAQMWCLPQHAKKEMDTDFAETITAALLERDKEIERLRKERNEARDYGTKMYNLSREITCVWCGHQFESSLGKQKDHLQAHAKQCKDHPAHKLEDALTAERKLADEMAITLGALLNHQHEDEYRKPFHYKRCQESKKILKEHAKAREGKRDE